MLSESVHKGARVLQFDLLLEFPDLFHAIFLKDTSLDGIEGLIDVPLHRMEQIHSNRVQPAPAKEAGDGLITHLTNQALMVKHADCQAALFYDPKMKLLGAIHAGWRGLVQEIYKETIHYFRENGSKPENIFVAIGPSLGPNQGEFKGWREYFLPSFGAFEVKENYFDLREVARSQLISEGILPHHMEIATLCTAEDPTRFHSWRRDKAVGRHGTVAFMY